MLNENQKTLLKAKLDPGHVAQREQGGRKLSYIEGWHAIAEANRIFEFDGWNRETLRITLVNESPRIIGASRKDGWGVTYIAHCRITVGEIVREGTGTGHGIDVDKGLAHESAVKEAETDAMKRALMTFGNQFGLALYDKSQANVGKDTSWMSDDDVTPEQFLKAKLDRIIEFVAAPKSTVEKLEVGDEKTRQDPIFKKFTSEQIFQYDEAIKAAKRELTAKEK